ncbi:transmembrane 220 family protein [Mucilaginibacter segetis]|uniref:Transmembrane 220 family protein n=1 Tax=Mucilaginibacter segetis TaxID=2793071 RepID=A0A934UNJ6_9SPHI|nr:transmembrane 220 family protein [Mucilaginibacter segetis]MBK0379971.1 transmembrane 220 family protein [Mucilaginibacter segetis]
MKIFNLLFFVLFIFFAALQYNDPDPYLWMPIYLYSSALCYFAAKRKFYPKAYLAGIIVYAAYGAYLFFDKTGVLDWVEEHQAESMVQTMQATKPWIEESREFFGLMILIVVLSVNWIYSARVTKNAKKA